MRTTAQADGIISEPIPIVNGVKHSCVLTPTLFGIYFSVILREVKQNANLANPGVGLRTRFDANLLSTSGLKGKTKTTTLHVCEAQKRRRVDRTKRIDTRLQNDDFVNDLLRKMRKSNPVEWQTLAQQLRRIKLPMELIGNVDRRRYVRQTTTIATLPMRSMISIRHSMQMMQSSALIPMNSCSLS